MNIVKSNRLLLACPSRQADDFTTAKWLDLHSVSGVHDSCFVLFLVVMFPSDAQYFFCYSCFACFVFRPAAAVLQLRGDINIH